MADVEERSPDTSDWRKFRSDMIPAKHVVRGVHYVNAGGVAVALIPVVVTSDPSERLASFFLMLGLLLGNLGVAYFSRRLPDWPPGRDISEMMEVAKVVIWWGFFLSLGMLVYGLVWNSDYIVFPTMMLLASVVGMGAATGSALSKYSDRS